MQTPEAPSTPRRVKQDTELIESATCRLPATLDPHVPYWPAYFSFESRCNNKRLHNSDYSCTDNDG
jgi:hypothetical protein